MSPTGEVHEDLSLTGSRLPKFMFTTKPVFPTYSDHPVLAVADPPITLRRLRLTDLPAFHELRSQYEVMKWTSTGKVDADINATRTWMTRFIAMEESLENSKVKDLPTKVKEASSSQQFFNFAIVYREHCHDPADPDAHDEIVIGVAGCHRVEPKPECGYMIRQEYWGRGIASATLKTFLEAYWNLERTNVNIEYDAVKHKQFHGASSYATSNDTGETVCTIPEVLHATIEATNIASKRVLEKNGFAYVCSEKLLDQYGRGEEELAYYTLARPSEVSQ